jgi:DNA-binding transcriptional LysR family regulator
MDRLEEWRIFVAVGTLRSFAEAARTLGRSPQSVTRAVAALEERVGARLLNRTTRSVSVTNEGERCLERGRRALAEFELLESPIDPRNAPLRGAVTVTAPILFGQLNVVPIVVELLGAQPRLDVRLLLFDRVVSLAEEGVDVAVRIGALPDSSLRARIVGHVRPVLCASPSYLERAGRPRSPDALTDHSCIAFTATTPIADRWRFHEEGKRERSVAVKPRLVVNTGQAAIDAAASGLGIVRVLSYQVDRLVAEGKLVVLLRAFEREPMPVQLVHLPGTQSRAAEAFTELAVERLRTKLNASAARPRG